MGLLTHTFNHMTQRLAESQSQVASYQRTLEDKVAQRTKELEIATAHAYKLAQHDILTGLPNRSLLNSRLKQILSQAQREHVQVACLFLDFDHFKRINDTLGHDAGDQLLQAIAQRLTSAVRESDTVARLGGDEFVIDPARPRPRARDVRGDDGDRAHPRVVPRAVPPRQPGADADLLDRRVDLSARRRRTPATLIKQADTAMYAAKEAGPQRVPLLHRRHERARAAAAAARDRHAPRADGRRVLPRLPAADRDEDAAARPASRRCCAGAIPSAASIAPAEFIPIAEESGMIQALGARVLRDACRQVMQWHRRHVAAAVGEPVGAAAAARQLAVGRRGGAARERARRRSYLDLEITESVIITHPEKAVATLVKLKQMGVSITVDDFGTGYSSLSYLARLPIQSVKIDQRFVRGLEQNRNDEAITQAIIALSHSLGLRVIAEGVETAGAIRVPEAPRLRGGAGLPDLAAARGDRAAPLVVRPREQPRHASHRRSVARHPGFANCCSDARA